MTMPSPKAPPPSEPTVAPARDIEVPKHTAEVISLRPHTPQWIDDAAGSFALEAKKGGKGGEGGSKSAQFAPDRPPSPALPPSDGQPAQNVPTVPDLKPESVYTSAPINNPVIAALCKERLYQRALDAKRHAIECPWKQEHRDDEKSSVYIEPDEQNPFGTYHCEYSHSNEPGIHHLLDQLGVDPDKARCRPRIRLLAGELNPIVAAAEKVLAARGTHYQSNGSIVTPVLASGSLDIRLSLETEAALTIALSAAADWGKYDGRAKAYKRCDPPIKTVQLLLKAPAYEYLPRLTGLARQPYFRNGSGEFIAEPGYDPGSGIYAHFDADRFVLPEPTRKNAEIALAELKALIAEFHFDEPQDRSATLSAMLTAAGRSTLPLAPAFNITAAAPGSGKSYLAATIAPFAGPAAPMYMSYPANSEEASKAMLAALIEEPAVIAFDDMQTDWLPYGMMNRLLTSETISERILGSTRVATARTNAFVIGTGNNVWPVRDMSRRVVTIRLSPKAEAPSTLQYNGRPAEEVRSSREKYVGHALTIIRAWKAAGSLKTEVPVIGSFETWSDVCRHPLIWLGEPDPASSLLQQLKADPDRELLVRFLSAWSMQFGERQMTVREIIKRAEQDADSDLSEALADLPVMAGTSINASKLGWYFKRNADRLVDGYKLLRDPTSERTAWRVELSVERAAKVEQETNAFRPDPEDRF